MDRLSDIHHEILARKEVAALTGRSHRASQIQWLSDHGWRAEINAAGAPIIGRWYARMKLAGINLSAASPREVARLRQGTVIYKHVETKKLLGHSTEAMTSEYVRARVGEKVSPVLTSGYAKREKT